MYLNALIRGSQIYSALLKDKNKWVGLDVESLHRVCCASPGGSQVKYELFLIPCTQCWTSKCDPNLVLTLHLSKLVFYPLNGLF